MSILTSSDEQVLLVCSTREAKLSVLPLVHILEILKINKTCKIHMMPLVTNAPFLVGKTTPKSMIVKLHRMLCIIK